MLHITFSFIIQQLTWVHSAYVELCQDSEAQDASAAAQDMYATYTKLEACTILHR